MFEDAIKQLINAAAERAADIAVRRYAQEHQPKVQRIDGDLDVRELMTATKWAKQTIYQYNSRGVIPGARHIGGKLVFRREEVLPWIEAGCPTIEAR